MGVHIWRQTDRQAKSYHFTVAARMQVIDSTPTSAANNMAKDELLLRSLESNGEAILHFYEWEKPAATYGYFTKPPSDFIDNTQIDLARRPTGGGIIFHQYDLAFSLLIPKSHCHFTLNTLQNYQHVHTKVIMALQKLYPQIDFTLLQSPPLKKPACGNFCMAAPSQYDVMVDKQKVAGGAQRRTRMGYLHQGSICLQIPTKDALTSFFKSDSSIAAAILNNSFALVLHEPIADARRKLKEQLIISFKQWLRADCMQ